MIVCFVGKSNSGKTSIITRIVPILKNKGLKIAVIKHTYKDFEVDKKGKDSWRIFQSGADVLIASPAKLAFIKRVKTDDLESICEYLKDYDLVITEGFSKTCKNKIIVLKNKNDLKDYKIDSSVIAIISDEEVQISNIKIFRKNYQK